MVKAAVIVLVAAASVTACERERSAPEPPRPADTTTSSSSTSSTTAPEARAGLRASIPMSVGCSGAPPFEFGYLPAGFRRSVEPGVPRTGTTIEPFGGELYDPLFHLSGPRGQYLHLYHGNSWRLVPTPRRELTVLGRPAVLSVFDDGHPIVEFQVSGSGSGCDWWAVEGIALDEPTLVRIVSALRLR